MSKHIRHIINANRKHKEGDGKHFMAYPLYQAQAFCNSARIHFQDVSMREVMCVHTHTQFFLCSQGSQAHLRSSADFLWTVDRR